MKKYIVNILFVFMPLTVVLAESGEDHGAQVYEIKVKVKTSTAKKGSLSPKMNPFVLDSDEVVYRVQGTQTWKGLIWGCSCDALRGEWKLVNDAFKTVAGCVIWNSKAPYNILFLDDMRWSLLHAIDSKGNKCEAAWSIGDISENSSAFLAFSGFGKLDIKRVKNDGGALEIGCRSYVKSLSGNVAGWMLAPEFKIAGKEPECTFCGVIDQGYQDLVEASEAWSFCPCSESYGNLNYTAVSGTWTIKYNANLSKKLSQVSNILEVYTKFPSNVESAVRQKSNEVGGN